MARQNLNIVIKKEARVIEMKPELPRQSVSVVELRASIWPDNYHASTENTGDTPSRALIFLLDPEHFRDGRLRILGGTHPPFLFPKLTYFSGQPCPCFPPRGESIVLQDSRWSEFPCHGEPSLGRPEREGRGNLRQQVSSIGDHGGE